MWYHRSFSDNHEVIECLESGEKIERKKKKVVWQGPRFRPGSHFR